MNKYEQAHRDYITRLKANSGGSARQGTRSWYDYNPDPLGEARPTVTRTRLKSGRNWERLKGGNPRTWHLGGMRESYKSPYVHPYEILDQLKERFEQQPVRFTTDPKTGKVIATKSMAKPELPSELRGARRFRPWFGEGELTSKWVLPEGALTGPRFIQRQAPTSDVQRQMGHRFGVSNIGQNVATVNPQTFWPESAFKLPMREAGAATWGGGRYGGAYGKKEPVFGGTVDYTTGTWRTPPGAGGYADPYGRFEGARKTPPTIGAFRPARFGGSRRGGRSEQQPEAVSAYTQSQRDLVKRLRRFYL